MADLSPGCFRFATTVSSVTYLSQLDRYGHETHADQIPTGKFHAMRAGSVARYSGASCPTIIEQADGTHNPRPAVHDVTACENSY
jgi:hypothetical protein